MKKNATCWLFPSGKWWKILLIMKLKIFFLLVSLGTLQAAGYSQDSRFNLKKNDVLLTEVLQELQQQSEYRFFYQKDIFQQADRVNVDMKNVSLRQILDEVLNFTGELPLLGHQIIFDYGFLVQAAVNQKRKFEKYGVDTLKLCRYLMPGAEKKNLGAACAYFGVHQDTAHRALSDAYAGLKLHYTEKYGSEKSNEPS